MSMRIKKPSRNSSPLIKLIEITLQAHLNKWFSVRNKFNQEKIALVSQSKEFTDDIQRIRKSLKIPELDPEEDYNEIPVLEGYIEDSSWLHGQTNQYIQQFNKKIRQVLEKYDLSKAFTDWIEWWVLYKQKPKGYPYFYPELLQLIKHGDVKELERIGLTANEKQMVKSYIAFLAKIKRRPTKENQKQYKNIKKQLGEILAISKNKRREFRSIKSALKTLKIGKLVKEKVEDERRGGWNEKYKPFTYNKLVVQEHSDEEGDRDATHNRRYRKQRQRLLERAKFLKTKLKK